jgi:hypothetical protein
MCSRNIERQRPISNRESAGGGARTHTILRSLDFESSASANSATPAFHSETLFYLWETAYFVHFHCNTNLKISRPATAIPPVTTADRCKIATFVSIGFLSAQNWIASVAIAQNIQTASFEHWSRWCIVALACHAINAPRKTVSMTKSF